MLQSEALQILQQKVQKCTLCEELVENRTQTVFGVGKPNADIVFCGEAPGKSEDLQGEPFVGKAGELLDSIINWAGWKREDIYILNILKCRPPNNRDPKEDEAKNCRPFLNAQIKTINPKYIICLGRIAAVNLLGLPQQTTKIGELRGKLHDYDGMKVLCTYHPAYLLRNPKMKQEVSEDLKILLGEINDNP